MHRIESNSTKTLVMEKLQDMMYFFFYLSNQLYTLLWTTQGIWNSNFETVLQEQIYNDVQSGKNRY